MNHDDMLDALECALADGDASEVLSALRDCLRCDGIDATSLPTNGPEPRDTYKVWTWTTNHLFVGTCADDVRAVPRV